MKYILLFTTLFGFTLLTTTVKADAWFDSVGYRYYHDLDNEHDGSKFRSYATKNLANDDKLKIAYERKRLGQGFEAGTFFLSDAEFCSFEGRFSGATYPDSGYGRPSGCSPKWRVDRALEAFCLGWTQRSWPTRRARCLPIQD